MEIAPVQRSSPIAASTAWSRPSGQATATQVATDLPPSLTVEQAAAGSAMRPDAPERSPDGVSPVVERSLSIDPDTHQIVYRAINDRGDVVLQMPDQVVMRRRAYAKEAQDAAEKNSRPEAVERFV